MLALITAGILVLARLLLETNTELKERGTRLVFAGLRESVRKELAHAGVTEAVGDEASFPTLSDALAYRNENEVGP